MVRFQEPIRGIGMLRMLRRQGFEVYTVDEFRTSTFCPSCGGMLRKCLRVQNPRKKFRKKRLIAVCHRLLECTSGKCIHLKIIVVNSNGSGAKNTNYNNNIRNSSKTHHLVRCTAVATAFAAEAAQPSRRSKRRVSPGAGVVQPSGSTRRRVVTVASYDPEAQPSCCRSKREAATASTSAAAAPEHGHTAKRKHADWQ
ncbi:hypothetical protein EV178_003486 [Coemansia sp. RSA 1646]|nr:hypothetical protein EV178_003486 [Coemansia sp. RSA 1646]